MSLISFCGKVAAGVSVLIVLAFIGLVVLAVILIGIGAYKSATNPHITQQTAQEYQQVQENISHAQTAISGAVANVTGK